MNIVLFYLSGYLVGGQQRRVDVLLCYPLHILPC